MLRQLLAGAAHCVADVAGGKLSLVKTALPEGLEGEWWGAGLALLIPEGNQVRRTEPVALTSWAPAKIPRPVSRARLALEI